MRTLNTDEIAVWQCPLNSEPEALRLYRLLTSIERQRADRLLMPDVKRRFIISRGVLREILAQYLGCGPCEVEIQYTEQGKPYVAENIEFNLAHSADIALIAITGGHAVGVDIERLQQREGVLAVAERYFHPSEVQMLQHLPREQRVEGFFKWWCAKEAVLKAQGLGIAGHLQDFTVIFSEGEVDLEWHVAPGAALGQAWQVRMLELGSEYVGAVAFSSEISYQIQNMVYT